jgi:restriction endonuclease S subunit
MLTQIDARSITPDQAYPSLKASDIKGIKIPLPPIEIQREIVAELDGYQKIIDAAQTIVKTYKPTIKINPEWSIRYLNEISKNHDGKRRPVTKSDREKGDIPYYGASGIVDYVKNHIFDGDYLLISEDGANLTARSTPIAFSISGKTWVNNHAHILEFSDKRIQKFVEYYINHIDIKDYVTGSAQPKLNQANLNKIPVPLPGNDEVSSLIDALEAEQKLIDANKKLIETFQAKIKSKIAEVWGE